MGSEWVQTSVGDFLEEHGGEIKTGPFGTKLKASEYSEVGVPVISVGEVQLGRLTLHERTPKVDVDVTARMPEYLLETGDIVFGRKGAVERSARVRSEEDGWFLGSDGIRLRLPDCCDSRFIAYSFLTTAHKQWMVQHAAGTTMASLNEKIIRLIPLSLPPLPIQKAIADNLEVIDNKIALNRQINTTLESMAQALFKSWFVDFDPVIDNALAAGSEIPDELQARADRRSALLSANTATTAARLPQDIQQLFPDRFVLTEDMGWVPEGWESSCVGAEFDVTMGQSPPGHTYNENGDGLPFFQGRADFGFRYPSNRIYCSEPKRLAKKADTLVSVRAPVGDVNMASEECCIGRGVAAVRHLSGSCSYTYYSMAQLREHFKVYEGEGTVFGSINQQGFKALPVLTVPEQLVSCFDRISGGLDKKIELNTQGINSLANLRDSLLPKLLSGQLSIPEAEQALDKVN
ncbi:restriction endonuclease subunit S [Oceanobacter antarcticus]|uniref:Restriction endonuclease subunit S n=1 Tax=Oceanobacter antarcticus TaxID=3133425 RepID=A0ABW8NH07_9GAMM